MVGKRHWSEAEKARLSNFYGAVSNDRLRELFDDRSTIAIRNQANAMGLRKHPERIQEVARENVRKRWGPLKAPPEIET
jgi:hypothetical protein